MSLWIIKHKNWLLYLVVTTALGGWLGAIFFISENKVVILPGKTTSAHYQIELECSSCHTNERQKNVFTSSGVSNNACNNCHGEDLEKFSDSHPTRKFKNPENAVFVEHIDAIQCITCHEEHNAKVTGEMSVTLPQDYCAHCHQVTLENLPSHQSLAFDSCATAGCHNYHDNMALSPSFLVKHYGEPDISDDPSVAATNTLLRWLEEGNEPRVPFTVPPGHDLEDHLTHSRVGVSCADCHSASVETDSAWIASPDHNTCSNCHGTQVTDFLKGKHGMRLAHDGLSPMTPALARREMKAVAAHEALSCNSCHQPHKYDRNFAAMEACVNCHNDSHTLNYAGSPHARLWEDELAGGSPNSGVSCATCHMPRVKRGDYMGVNHNQNANLTPNEKMLRSVCIDCHGLQFSMDSLADRALIDTNFTGRPSVRHPGITWAADAAIARSDETVIAIKKHLESQEEMIPPNTTTTSQPTNENR